MKELQVFNFKGSKVRSLSIENEPWFVGKEIADILGYQNGSRDINRHVDKEDRQVIQNYQNGTLDIPNRGLTIINESGLYSLILSSKLPQAKEFKRWVTSEVLPTLRKTGSYQLSTNPMDALKLMFQATEQIEARVTELENVQTISQSEYAEIGTRIRKRINDLIKSERLIVKGKQRKKLFDEFNHEVLIIGGVKHRNQILKKDYYKVMDFINDWKPSKATIIGILGYEQQDFSF